MTRDELVETFAGFPDRFAAAARAAADGGRSPDGEWGPSEIVRHLIAVEREVWSGTPRPGRRRRRPALGLDRAGPRPGPR